MIEMTMWYDIIEHQGNCSLGLPWWFKYKESPYNAGDPGSIPGSGRSVGEGYGNLIQYSCLKFPLTEEPGGLQSMESQRIGHD